LLCIFSIERLVNPSEAAPACCQLPSFLCATHVLNRLSRLPFRGSGQNWLTAPLTLTLTSLLTPPTIAATSLPSLLHIELRKHSPHTSTSTPSTFTSTSTITIHRPPPTIIQPLNQPNNITPPLPCPSSAYSQHLPRLHYPSIAVQAIAITSPSPSPSGQSQQSLTIQPIGIARKATSLNPHRLP
jgi:hypothetical protein